MTIQLIASRVNFLARPRWYDPLISLSRVLHRSAFRLCKGCWVYLLSPLSFLNDSVKSPSGFGESGMSFSPSAHWELMLL